MIIKFLVIDFNVIPYCATINIMFIYQSLGKWKTKYILSLLFKKNHLRIINKIELYYENCRVINQNIRNRYLF
jgi:hypothetical protein